MPNTHYWHDYPANFKVKTKVACGARSVEAAADLRHVTCGKCKESEVYKNALYQVEIGFDGDMNAWINSKGKYPE